MDAAGNCLPCCMICAVVFLLVTDARIHTNVASNKDQRSSSRAAAAEQQLGVHDFLA